MALIAAGRMAAEKRRSPGATLSQLEKERGPCCSTKAGGAPLLSTPFVLLLILGLASAIQPPAYDSRRSNGLSATQPPPPPPSSSSPPPPPPTTSSPSSSSPSGYQGADRGFPSAPSWPPSVPVPRKGPQEEGERAKRNLNLGDLMNRFGQVVKSPEFAQLAGNLNDIVEEVSGHKVDIQEGVLGIVQKADEALGGFANAAELALKNYRSVHSEFDGLFREGFVKLIERGLKQLMTDRSIQASLHVVNATTILVQEHMARTAAFTSNRSEAEVIILKHMARTAEDLEALGLTVVNSTLFSHMYPEDAPTYVQLLHARLVPRLMLVVTCSLLHGLDPLSDPIYALLVVAFASGTLTKELTASLLSRLQVALSGDMITNDWFFNRLPDVWKTSEPAVEMGYALNGMFRDLEERDLIGAKGSTSLVGGRHTKKGALLLHATTALSVGRRHGITIVSIVVAVIAALIISRVLLTHFMVSM